MLNGIPMKDRVKQNVALAHSLTEWLGIAGLGDHPKRADLAVDLADILTAAELVREGVDALLRLNPSVPSDADSALTLATGMEAQLFGELKNHVRSLERAWPALVERLDQVSSGLDSEEG
jgi:hypothetical protein